MADFVMPVETQPSPSLSGQSFMGYLIDHVPSLGQWMRRWGWGQLGNLKGWANLFYKGLHHKFFTFFGPYCLDCNNCVVVASLTKEAIG